MSTLSSSWARISGSDRDPAAGKGGAHRGEVGGGRARVIDRHQRFVERLGDQGAGPADAQHGVDAERGRDCAHQQERDQDTAADGPAKAESPCQATAEVRCRKKPPLVPPFDSFYPAYPATVTGGS